MLLGWEMRPGTIILKLKSHIIQLKIYHQLADQRMSKLKFPTCGFFYQFRSHI